MEQEQTPQHSAEAGEEAGAAKAEAEAEELINVATEALAAGDIGRALRAARQATEVAPSLAAAWVLRGTVAEEAGQIPEAIEAYRAALEVDPDRPALAERIEELCARLEREQSTPSPRISSMLDRYAPAFLALSVALLVLAIGLAFLIRARRAAFTQQQYERVMELGIRYLAQDQLDQAIGAFTDALRLRPNDPEAQRMLQQAKQRQQVLVQLRQWNYATAGGRFPGQEGTLPPAEITPTRERREQQTAAMSAGRTSSWQSGGGTYHWGPPTGRYDFPSPRQEFGPPEYMASSEPTQVSAPSQPGSPQITQPATAAPQQTAPPQQATVPQQTGAQQPSGTLAQPRGYVRIVVGEPKPPGETVSSSPSADAVREQADQLRRAGKLKEARSLYQQAIELYRKEAQADPTARAAKEAGIESCRQAMEQCE